MKVLVIGAGGIIGQHLMISVPAGVEAVFTRRQGDEQLYQSLDLLEACRIGGMTDWVTPESVDVVVNLAGEAGVDEVERNPDKHRLINVEAVRQLMSWCDVNDKHLIHVSSQAVIGPRVNEYGRQKYDAEEIVRKGKNWTIIRPTFVLGIRPFPGIGRENPAERILSGKEEESVCDRFFSVSFAWDVAEVIWDACQGGGGIVGQVIQVGDGKMSRWDLARKLGVCTKSVQHDNLNLAQRQIDTSYQQALTPTPLESGFILLEAEYGQRTLDALPCRAKEIAAFLHRPWQDCLAKLQSGFGTLHGEVTEDFHRVNPQTDE